MGFAFFFVVDKVKLNFGATIITEHPFTPGAIQQLMFEAEAMIAEEEKKLAAGGDPEDWDSDENKAKYLKPVPKTQATTAMEKFIEKFLPDDAPGRKRQKSNKMANLVEMMMKTEIDKKNSVSEQDSTPHKEPRSPTRVVLDTTDTVACVDNNAIVMIKDSYTNTSKDSPSITDSKEIPIIDVSQTEDSEKNPDESTVTAENGSAAYSWTPSKDFERKVHNGNKDLTASASPTDSNGSSTGGTDRNRLGKRSKSCVIL